MIVPIIVNNNRKEQERKACEEELNLKQQELEFQKPRLVYIKNLLNKKIQNSAGEYKKELENIKKTLESSIKCNELLQLKWRLDETTQKYQQFLIKKYKDDIKKIKKELTNDKRIKVKSLNDGIEIFIKYKGNILARTRDKVKKELKLFKIGMLGPIIYTLEQQFKTYKRVANSYDGYWYFKNFYSDAELAMILEVKNQLLNENIRKHEEFKKLKENSPRARKLLKESFNNGEINYNAFDRYYHWKKINGPTFIDVNDYDNIMRIFKELRVNLVGYNDTFNPKIDYPLTIGFGNNDKYAVLYNLLIDNELIWTQPSKDDSGIFHGLGQDNKSNYIYSSFYSDKLKNIFIKDEKKDEKTELTLKLFKHGRKYNNHF